MVCFLKMASSSGAQSGGRKQDPLDAQAVRQDILRVSAEGSSLREQLVKRLQRYEKVC